MKKYLFLLLAFSTLVSCDDIEVNEVALQAKVNDRLYISTDARASSTADGGILIQGFTDEESLTLRISKLKEGKFEIGEGKPNYAVFEDFEGNLFLTKPDGEGTVTITEINEATKTLSGSFLFNAMLPGIDTVYVSQGVMYNIPYTGTDISDPTNAGTFSAQVDGSPFLPFVVSARDTGNSIIVSGSTANATMAITVPSGVETGEYNLPKSKFNAKYQDGDGPQTTSVGQINILEHNPTGKTIKGTFSFLTNKVEITQGKFEVTY